MDRVQLRAALEAMIFVSEQPIDDKKLLDALAPEGVSREELLEALGEVAEEWNQNSLRGIGLRQVAGGYQFRTKEAFAPWIQRLSVPKTVKLTAAALETLAIIAYRQPCIRSEVESIRGVDSGGVIKTLLEKRLVRIVGRRDEAGQPLIYGTTREFLELFDLKDLKELPSLKDVEEFMRDKNALTDEPKEALLVVGSDDDEAEDDVDDDVEDDIDDDDEEETEVLPDHDDDDEDDEALEMLEESLRDLKEVEKGVVLPASPAEGGARLEEGTSSNQGADIPASDQSSRPSLDRSVQ